MKDQCLHLFSSDRLLNSCTVKDPSQAAFMHLVLKGKAAGKAVVVAGCVPQADRHIKGLEDVSMVGIQQVDRVVEVVEETLKGHTVRLLSKNRLPELDLPKIRKNPMVEIIPLSTGCLGACTYCKTRHARGKLGSYTPDAIVHRVKQVIDEGVTEIWLSSEDTGAYGIDIGTNLPTLLRAILEVLPDGVMLRVGMTNPPYILEHLDDIADILNHDAVFAFLHVPVQSGSDDVLLAMNREYTVADFSRVVDVLLEKVPGVTLATDIICGFPGETEEDFDQTMALVTDKYCFHIMNISQFYPRPGTPAAKMRRVPTQVVKNRSRRLTKAFEVLAPYVKMVGTTQKVWINTELSDDQRFTVGHTKNYTKVLLPRDDTLIGCTAMVEITTAARFHINGVVRSRSEPATPAAAAIRATILRDGRSTNTTTAMANALSMSCADESSCGSNAEGGCCSQSDNALGCEESNDTPSSCCSKTGKKSCCGSGKKSCCGSKNGGGCGGSGGGGCCSEKKVKKTKTTTKTKPKPTPTRAVATPSGASPWTRFVQQLQDDPVTMIAAVTMVASVALIVAGLRKRV
ncbi:hypothetical protein PINS_up001190 [Pythium insidiosum]|nr:hypothetical protein PINS_up001190 [Pythium insidiosum]